MMRRASHRPMQLISFCGALSQQGLLDPVKPAYDRHWPDGWLS